MSIKETYNELTKHEKLFVKIIMILSVILIIKICIIIGLFIYLLHQPVQTAEPTRVPVETVSDRPANEIEPVEEVTIAGMIPDDPEPVVEETPVASEEVAEPVYTPVVEETQPVTTNTYSNSGSFQSDGVWYDDSYRYTWYSSNAAYHYRTPEWTAGSDGIYRDSEGYVVVASSDHAQGTVINNTPFGPAKVYDTGCASGTLDVYTNF